MSHIKSAKSIMDEFADIEKEVDEIRVMVGVNDLPALQEETRELWDKDDDVHPDEVSFYQDALYHRI